MFSCTWDGVHIASGCIANASVTCIQMLSPGLCDSKLIPAIAGTCVWEGTCMQILPATACGIASTESNCDIADHRITNGCWFDAYNTGANRCIARQTPCALVSSNNCELSPLLAGYEI